MWEAVLFGVLATSSLVVGGALGSYWDAPKRVTGVMLAFASGRWCRRWPSSSSGGGRAGRGRPGGGGLLAGAAVFVVVNTWLDSRVAPPEEAEEAARRAAGPRPRPRTRRRPRPGGQAPDARELAGLLQQREKVEVAAASAGWPCWPPPSSTACPRTSPLGVSLADEESAGGSLALLAGIFAANFPEALVGAVAMRARGLGTRFHLRHVAGHGPAAEIPPVIIGRAALARAEPRHPWPSPRLRRRRDPGRPGRADAEAFERGRRSAPSPPASSSPSSGRGW